MACALDRRNQGYGANYDLVVEMLIVLRDERHRSKLKLFEFDLNYN